MKSDIQYGIVQLLKPSSASSNVDLTNAPSLVTSNVSYSEQNQQAIFTQLSPKKFFMQGSSQKQSFGNIICSKGQIQSLSNFDAISSNKNAVDITNQSTFVNKHNLPCIPANSNSQEICVFERVSSISQQFVKKPEETLDIFNQKLQIINQDSSIKSNNQYPSIEVRVFQNNQKLNTTPEKHSSTNSLENQQKKQQIFIQDNKKDVLKENVKQIFSFQSNQLPIQLSFKPCEQDIKQIDANLEQEQEENKPEIINPVDQQRIPVVGRIKRSKDLQRMMGKIKNKIRQDKLLSKNYSHQNERLQIFSADQIGQLNQLTQQVNQNNNERQNVDPIILKQQVEQDNRQINRKQLKSFEQIPKNKSQYMSQLQGIMSSSIAYETQKPVSQTGNDSPPIIEDSEPFKSLKCDELDFPKRKNNLDQEEMILEKPSSVKFYEDQLDFSMNQEKFKLPTKLGSNESSLKEQKNGEKETSKKRSMSNSSNAVINSYKTKFENVIKFLFRGYVEWCQVTKGASNAEFTQLFPSIFGGVSQNEIQPIRNLIYMNLDQKKHNLCSLRRLMVHPDFHKVFKYHLQHNSYKLIEKSRISNKQFYYNVINYLIIEFEQISRQQELCLVLHRKNVDFEYSKELKQLFPGDENYFRQSSIDDRIKIARSRSDLPQWEENDLNMSIAKEEEPNTSLQNTSSLMKKGNEESKSNKEYKN